MGWGRHFLGVVPPSIHYIRFSRGNEGEAGGVDGKGWASEVNLVPSYPYQSFEPERETRDTDNKNLNEMNKGFLDYNILNFSYQIIDFLLHFFQLFTFYISWNSLRYFLPFMNETSGRD